MQNRQSVVVAQIGSRMHYAVPAVFASTGQLRQFYTDFYWNCHARGGSLIAKVGGARAHRMTERFHARIPYELVTSFNLSGMKYQIVLSRAKNIHETSQIFVEYGREFAQKVATQGFHGAGYYYGFSMGALETLQKARESNVVGVLEQMSLPSDQMIEIYSREYEAWPDWEPLDRKFEVDMQAGVVSEREMAEWQSADQIVVGSEFAAQGLQQKGICGEKIRILPYGVDLTHFFPATNKSTSQKTLRVLYVGAVSVRKGIPYLYLALKELSNKAGISIEAKCVGGVKLTDEAAEKLRAVCNLPGHVPRSNLPDIFRWADVFVFPSVCEGSATVVYEALASGLPVITTPNAGSIVRDGVDGFIVPARDSEALAERIERLARDPELRTRFAQAARERAQYGSLEAYGLRLAKLLVSENSLD